MQPIRPWGGVGQALGVTPCSHVPSDIGHALQDLIFSVLLCLTLPFYITYSSILEWECLLCAIVSWNHVIFFYFYKGLQLRVWLEAQQKSLQF
jgi:hypothetical protein